MSEVYKSRLWMYKRYVIERLKEEEIAKLAGTSQATIHRWIEKHKIKKRGDI